MQIDQAYKLLIIARKKKLLALAVSDWQKVQTVHWTHMTCRSAATKSTVLWSVPAEWQNSQFNDCSEQGIATSRCTPSWLCTLQ